MATTNITNIGRSQTISDIKPTTTVEYIPGHSSLISNIAFLVTAATIVIIPWSLADGRNQKFFPPEPTSATLYNNS